MPVCRTYDLRVQQLFVVGVSIAVLALLSIGVARRGAGSAGMTTPWRASLGMVAGLFGAIVVLVPRTDLVPDSIEPTLWALAIATVTAVTVGVVLRRR